LSNFKQFLDTSVARHLLVGSKPYKQYLYKRINRDNAFVSKYVQMELKRGYLCSIIDFYYVLHLPSVPTIGDAIKIWSDRYAKGELKAVLHLVGELFTNNRLNFSKISDKDTAIMVLESYIRRFALKVRKFFKEIGENTTRCARAVIDLPIARAKASVDDIRVFIEKINDAETCRKQCRIDAFIFRRFRADVEKLIYHGKKLSNPKSKENRGFTKIVTQLQELLDRGKHFCTCAVCAVIGDAVIALELPSSMRLETIDYSFEHLCPIIGKSYVRHAAQSAVVKNVGSNGIELKR
jgi:hypothetical protein